MSLTSDDRQYIKREIAKSQVSTAKRFDDLERRIDHRFTAMDQRFDELKDHMEERFYNLEQAISRHFRNDSQDWKSG